MLYLELTNPQIPFGALIITKIATKPSMIKYIEPKSANVSLKMKNTRTPIIGPSIVPIPPITTIKITNAVQSLMLNAASGDILSF